MSEHLTPSERETTITSTDAEDVVRIWTAQRPFITRLRNHKAFTEVKTGRYGSTEWSEFTIPADQWNPASGAKPQRKPMTPERKAAAAATLAALRAPGNPASSGSEPELQDGQAPSGIGGS